MAIKMSEYFPVDSFSNFSNPRYFENRNCPLCNGKNHRTISEFNNFQFFIDSTENAKQGTIRECQCIDCLTLFRNPRFTDDGFRALFSEAGCSYGSSTHRPEEQIDWLNSHGLLADGNIFLDVGCYEGKFLTLLPENITKIGVDIDAPAIIRGLAQNPDLRLFHGAFETFNPDQPPHVITLFHVLEHLPDPATVLRQLRRIGGKEVRLVIEVPILEFGETNDINGFFSIQHLTHFSRNSLHLILARTGWKVINNKHMDDYNGYRVLATPSSDTNKPNRNEEKSDLRHLQIVLDSWNLSKTSVEERISKLPDLGNFVIWGAGLHTEILYQISSLFRCKNRRFIIVDSDPLKQGKRWRGIPIENPQQLTSIDQSNTHVLISSYSGQPAIKKILDKLGMPEEKIITLYESVNSY